VRPTNVLAVVGLVITGVIIADFLIHPEGTRAVAKGFVDIEKPSLNALLGQAT